MKRRDFLKLTAVAGATLVAPGLRSLAVPREVNPFRVRSSLISLHHRDGKEFRGIGYRRLQTYADDWAITHEKRFVELEEDWKIEQHVFHLRNVKTLAFPQAFFAWSWGELAMVGIHDVAGFLDWECKITPVTVGPGVTVMFRPEAIDLELSA